MNLSTASRYAARAVELLSPVCERIAIVGSIRRRRPICNDIDLVCIPRLQPFEEKVDMFTVKQGHENLLRSFLISYVNNPANGATWLGRSNARGAGVASPSPGGEGRGEGGPVPKEGAINYLITGAKCQLDIFCATEATWATLCLCRTGSKEHNIWLAERAQTFALHWNPYKGLSSPSPGGEGRGEGGSSADGDGRGEGGPLITPDEASIYNALGLEYIDPADRELPFLQSLARGASIKSTSSTP